MFGICRRIGLFAGACLSAITIGAIASPIASAAPTAQGQTQAWSYDLDLYNNTYSTLYLVGATPAAGSHWAAAPSSTLAPGQRSDFEVTSTAGSAGATVTYADRANGGVVTFNGQADSTPNGSYSFDNGTGRLGATGPSGYFSGTNPELAVQYTIAAMP